jgi:hypothetical protein
VMAAPVGSLPSNKHGLLHNSILLANASFSSVFYRSQTSLLGVRS